MSRYRRSERGRLVAPIACALLATAFSFSAATAESGIPAGSAAVITAGQPVLVRLSPGWESEVAYELAQWAPVTVWDVEQAALDGSLWYPVDGGFVPVDAVTSVATLEARSGPSAEADAGEWVEPGMADPAASVPPPPQPPAAPPPPMSSVDPSVTDAAATEGWVDPVTGEWVAAAPAEMPADPAQDGGWVDPATGQWVEPAPGDASSAPPPPEGAGEKGRQIREAVTGGGGSGGEQIVAFALRYQGYPYVYAGEGPYAFDCSGFIKFVLENALGRDVSRDMAVQFATGQPVSRDALQPGDLVFFANTNGPGMSHNGIYIGGGQFVHAETEATGVTVSDLNADYYSSRWYGAVRFS